MNNISTNPSHQPGPDEKVVRRALGLYVIGLASRRYTNNLADRTSRWTCTTCQRDMHISNREAHLGGKAHQEATRCSNLTVPSLQASKSIEGSSPSPSTWKCEICDKIIQAKDKKAHLAGKVHRSNSLAPNQSLKPSAMLTRAHQTSKWKCTICQKEMMANQKDSHLAGKGHREAVSGPTIGARKKGDKSKARQPSRRHGKQSDDGDESSSSMSTESGLGLLHDIDTTFGLCPGGGAYKERNFYYGPGIHDYY